MSLFTILFSLQSIIFLIGINFLSKKIVCYLDLNKNFKLSVFSILILIISFCFHFLFLENFYYLKELSNAIYYFFIFIGYYTIILKLINFQKEKLVRLNYYDIIFFLILANILFASLVPVTDADSIRYHLGQFNNNQRFLEYDLHSKISYIGDGFNVISYYSNSLNIISCLNFYYIFKVISLIKNNFLKRNKIILALFFLSIPIYLNLIISQKPFLWLIFNLFYIFILNHKNFIKKNLTSFIIIIINLSLIQISKPEFLIIVPMFIVYLIFTSNLKLFFSLKKNFNKLLIFLTSVSFFPLIFFTYNYLNFSDPTKILIFQNNIVEEKFVSFLQNSNISMSFSNIFEFFLNLGFPIKYINYFSISLGLGFFVCVIFLKFRFNKEFIFIFSLLLLNLILLRINIEEHHSRNYILIFIILIYLYLKEKILYKNFIKTILIIQLFITQLSFFYFNYEIYIKNNYENITHNLKNEKLIFNTIKDYKNSLVLTTIDGNLFKRYKYVNIDYYNFNNKYFFENLKQNLEKNQNIKNLILILKDKKENPLLNQFYKNEIDLYFRTRNPLKKEELIKYKIYFIPIEFFINSKDLFF